MKVKCFIEFSLAKASGGASVKYMINLRIQSSSFFSNSYLLVKWVLLFQLQEKERYINSKSETKKELGGDVNKIIGT